MEPLIRSRLSWTRPGNWHLTLKFLGDVDPGRMEDVRRSLGGVGFESFSLQGLGAGIFPAQGRPRVLWVGLGMGAEEGRGLAQAVETVLVPLGFPAEDRPFAPHLTLARVKLPERDNWRDVLAALDGLEWPVCRIDRLVLWRSELSPQGPAYTPLAEFPARG